MHRFPAPRALASVAAEGGELAVLFAVQDATLRIEGAVTLASGVGDDGLVDELTAQILAAVVDGWELTTTDGTARFTCVRRVPEPDA